MSNLYAAPAADMSSPLANSQTYVPKMFELNGRIGRVRYLVYASVISILMMFAIGLVLGLLAKAVGVMMLVGIALVIWIPMMVVLFFVLRRRLHDMGKSGWFGLLQFIPLVNLGFFLWILFGRGNDGDNQYGPAPAPNTRPLVIFAWLIPIAMVASMPSYLKFEDQLVKQMMGTSAGASDDSAEMQKQVDEMVRAAEAESADGAGNDVVTDEPAAAQEPAPAEPKPAN